MHVQSAESLIARHPALAAYREQLGGAPKEAAGDAASQARSSDGPLAGTKDPYVTLKDLNNRWGESDAIYDLNADGKVDISDMLALLAMGGTSTDERAPITVDGMMKDWGTVDSVYDLDFDGTVGMKDLLMLLAEGGEMSAPPPPPHSGGGSGRIGDSPSDSRPPIAAPPAGVLPAKSNDDALPVNDVRPLPTEVAVKKMSDLLISRLEKAGYTHRPPANVHNIVDQLQFKIEHRQSILERIAERYPNGLGLQIRA